MLAGSIFMVSFEDTKRKNQCGGFILQSYDEYDEYFQQPEKKRRLKGDQTQFQYKSFETENKLEPAERKFS